MTDAGWYWPSRTTWSLALRELLFNAVCRHRQGDAPNVLLYCNRRGGSTWMMNTMAAHPGCRYVGRPFLTLLLSRHRRRVPSLARRGKLYDEGKLTQIVSIPSGEEQEFRALADDIINGRIEIYPSVNFRAPYFHRVTNRMVLQMTSGGSLIEWFDEHFNVMSGILLRHPISNALSIMARGWSPHADEYLDDIQFVDTQLTGHQVDLGRKIMASGSELARHVLDWTLKFLVPLRAFESGRYPSWIAWTYEETVEQPEAMIGLIAGHFKFTDVEPMLQQARRASRTATRSTAERLDDKQYVLSRWREKVGHEEEASLLNIPAAFGLTVYRPGRDGPSRRYRHMESAESRRS